MMNRKIKRITPFEITKGNFKMMILNWKMIDNYRKLPKHKQNVVRHLLNQSVLVGTDWIKPVTKIISWFYGLHGELFEEQSIDRKDFQ